MDVFLEKAFWEHGKTRDYKIYRKELGDDLGTILMQSVVFEVTDLVLSNLK